MILQGSNKLVLGKMEKKSQEVKSELIAYLFLMVIN